MRLLLTRILPLLGAAALLPTTLVAEGLMVDGRAGPMEMTDETLDVAMDSLNDYLQAKYAEYDMLATLDTARGQDFATVAMATAATPFDRPGSELGPFGWTVDGGESLDLHLASFQEEVMGRGDDLFVRIAREQGGTTPDFQAVASDVQPGLLDRGRVHDDPSLNTEMLALLEGMRAFDERLAQVSAAVPVVTGESFERFGEALLLF